MCGIQTLRERRLHCHSNADLQGTFRGPSVHPTQLVSTVYKFAVILACFLTILENQAFLEEAIVRQLRLRLVATTRQLLTVILGDAA